MLSQLSTIHYTPFPPNTPKLNSASRSKHSPKEQFVLSDSQGTSQKEETGA
jgi:hypothetical protein